jgi:uncharacterized protein YbcC (UPF0753/DUF2309 family)
LGGRAFLHEYQWQADAGFQVLELIVTAPMVVANWINMRVHSHWEPWEVPAVVFQ